MPQPPISPLFPHPTLFRSDPATLCHRLDVLIKRGEKPLKQNGKPRYCFVPFHSLFRHVAPPDRQMLFLQPCGVSSDPAPYVLLCPSCHRVAILAILNVSWGSEHQIGRASSKER